MRSKSPVKAYLKALEETYRSGSAREESFYPHLKSLIEELSGGKVEVIQAPSKEEFGFPDFKVIRSSGGAIVGYIEAKRPGANLDAAETSEQLKRYFNFVPNLILTDFVEFRLYRNGKLRDKVSLAINNLPTIGKLTPKPSAEKELNRLLNLFLSFSMPAIKSMDKLADELARRARVLKEAIARNVESRAITDIYETIKNDLIPDLSPGQFADILAQTLTYSLLIGKLNAKRRITLDNVGNFIPQKLKLIRSIVALFVSSRMVEGVPDEIRWALDDIVNVVNAYAGGINYRDVATYFYEPFLKRYDPELKEIRGVYYTPREVISFINRGVDTALEDLGYENGLANESVKLLDPCFGTGAFISDAVDRTLEKHVSLWGNADTRRFIDEHVLENFYGFEILIAPYVIGHLTLDAMLKELGYRGDKAFRLYLTNTLERPGSVHHQSKNLLEQVLTDEKAKADAVKDKEPIIAIVGNPPYNKISANKNKWIVNLLKKTVDVGGEEIQSYYEIDGKPLKERKVNLQDDYVKFIRFAQWKIAKTGKGIVGYITNHAYLDNPTFRGMRQSLLKTFDRIYILNLHGNKRKREDDENVFDIQQGVAIGIFIKEKRKNDNKLAKVFYFSTLEAGLKTREEKLKFLSENTLASVDWKELNPESPSYFFVPTTITKELREEYERGWKVTNIFVEKTSGVATSRDRFVIDFDKHALVEKIKTFVSDEYTDKEVQKVLNLKENYRWRVKEARQKLREDLATHDLHEYIIPILYRPFDVRWIFYHPAVVWRPRIEVMIHMLRGENVGLAIGRQWEVVGSEQYDVAFVSKIPTDFNLFRRGGNKFSPLYLYLPNPRKPDPHNYIRVPNFTQEFQKFLKERYGDKVSPEDVLHYIYAILYHPEYRTRYAEFLKYDF
ncbi:MAG: N-6 DNA methylase, partial [Thermotogae bacterium]|nr:N-6 DNA methylase [Thermotogota bacterium]